MQPSRRVAQHHVHMTCLGGLQGVEQHGAGIGALVLADDVHTGAVGPDLQLVGGGGAEGISGAQQHLLALRLQLGGQLADGRGLAHAVDADEQHDAGGGGQVQGGVAHLQLLRQDGPQGVLHLVGPGQQPLLHLFAQLLHRVGGGIHAHVRQDQRLLQLVVKFVVQLIKCHRGQPCLLELLEKSHRLLLI